MYNEIDNESLPYPDRVLDFITGAIITYNYYISAKKFPNIIEPTIANLSEREDGKVDYEFIDNNAFNILLDCLIYDIVNNKDCQFINSKYNIIDFISTLLNDDNPMTKDSIIKNVDNNIIDFSEVIGNLTLAVSRNIRYSEDAHSKGLYNDGMDKLTNSLKAIGIQVIPIGGNDNYSHKDFHKLNVFIANICNDFYLSRQMTDEFENKDISDYNFAKLPASLGYIFKVNSEEIYKLSFFNDSADDLTTYDLYKNRIELKRI